MTVKKMLTDIVYDGDFAGALAGLGRPFKVGSEHSQ